MKTVDVNRPSLWQLVFAQSKVNGGRYSEEELPFGTWNWPKDTYLQQRLREATWQLGAETHPERVDRFPRLMWARVQ